MLKNGLICVGFLVSHELIGGFVFGWLTSALGQKQPLSMLEILPPERLVSG